jgi:hypothetical protein
MFGLALAPTSLLALGVSLRALAAVCVRAPAAAPFAAGFSLALAFWLFSRYLVEGGPGAWLSAAASRVYVFGHELTHALAAWSIGGKVHSFHVGEEGGHVDVSETNAFVALAPYCVPIYTLGVVAGWRAALHFHPSAPESAFLVLTGLTLSFHVFKTFECLWDRRQPDLAAAGGAVFSLSWIALANGLVILLLAKALFPRSVDFSGHVRSVAYWTSTFWSSAWHRIPR